MENEEKSLFRQERRDEPEADPSAEIPAFVLGIVAFAALMFIPVLAILLSAFGVYFSSRCKVRLYDIMNGLLLLTSVVMFFVLLIS